MNKQQERTSAPKGGRIVFLILLAIAAISSIPVFTGYCIDGHDLYFHVIRIEGLAEGLRSGQFPVRLNPTFLNGYGYPNPIFYGEILMYPAAVLRLLGVGLSSCYLFYVVCINLLTTFGSYYSFHGIWRERSLAVGCTLLYVLAPYRLVDLYLREAGGEYAALAFLPLVLYGMYRIYTEDFAEERSKWCFLPLTIGLSGIVQTHVLTGEITGGVIFVVCIILFRKTFQKKRFFALLKAALATVLFNLWFLVPFADYMLTQDIWVFHRSMTVKIQATGAYPTQLFALFLKYALDQGGPEVAVADEMPLPLGLPLGLGLLLFAVMFFVLREKRVEKSRGGLIFLGAVLAVWMSSIYFPWDGLSSLNSVFAKLISSLQFAWRMLAPATVLAVACTGFGLLLLREKGGQRIAVGVMTVLAVLTVAVAVHFMWQCLEEQPPIRWESAEDLPVDTVYAASSAEYVLSNYNREVLMTCSEPRLSDGITLTDYSKEGLDITCTVSASADGCMFLPLLNYKGYELTSEDGALDSGALAEGDGATVRVNIPAGYNGTIHVRYAGMWYWHLAEVVSGLSVLGLILLRVWYRRKDRK